MKKIDLIFTAILVPVDFLMLMLAALSAYFLRFSTAISEIRPVIFNLPFYEYFIISIFVSMVWLVVFAFSGLYSTKKSQRIIDEFYKIFTACTVGVMLILLFIFASRELFSSRFIVLIGWVFAIAFVFFGRFFVDRVRKKLFKKGVGVSNLLIIGTDNTSKKIISLFKDNTSFGYCIVGVIKNLDDNLLEKITNFIKENKDSVVVDEILQCEDVCGEKSSKLVDICNENHITYRYIPNLFETRAINVEVMDLAGVPIIELKGTQLDGWGKIFKRFFDIIGSVVGIVMFLPVMILVAIAIKIDSSGPIFFGYNRIGQNGKPFFYFKFRSMIVDAHKMRYDESFRKSVEDIRGWNNDNPMVKYKNDPRITRVGKFIRKYSIDELPEFFNVLVGKMSLVGPRPHEPEEVAKYKAHHKKLLSIKPGISGLSQISGRSDLSFEDEVKLDIFYIENWSIRLDLYILFKTPFILFKKRRAS